MREARASILVAGVAWCAVAGAVPPDARIALAPGSETFLKPPFAPESVFVEPVGAFTAEVMPGGELFVAVSKEARGAGLLFARAAGRLYAWDVCFAADAKDPSCPKETSPEEATKACRGLKEGTEDRERVWQGEVKDLACFDAIRRALRHATVPPRSLRLVVEEEPARAFWARVETAIRKLDGVGALKSGYYGATLRLSGKASRRVVDEVLRLAWHETAGAVSYDADRLVLLPEVP